MKYLFLLLVLVSGCGERRDWPKCSQQSHQDPKPGQMTYQTLGSLAIDGQYCRVQEIYQNSWHVDCNDSSTHMLYDAEEKCQYCVAFGAPVMQRLVCQ